VTRKQNQENVKDAYATSRTGVRGVFPGKKPGTYRVAVTHHGRTYNKHGFRSAEEATKYVVALRNQLFTHNDADRASEHA
jgi:membrane-bound lytic murein transglycosylase MltF